MVEQPERIWIWFADNGNIRKWQSSAFDEGTAFVRADIYDALVKERDALDAECQQSVLDLCRERERAERAEADRDALAADKAELLAALQQIQDDAAEGVHAWWDGRPGQRHGAKDALDMIVAQTSALLARHAAPAKEEGWRSIDTAPEDEHIILATSGGHVGEAIMLIDEDTGKQKWAWALGPVHANHEPYGWQPMPSAIDFPVPSDLRSGGFDGPTGAE